MPTYKITTTVPAGADLVSPAQAKTATATMVAVGPPGTRGDPTLLIDDTTPATDRTYSSSKELVTFLACGAAQALTDGQRSQGLANLGLPRFRVIDAATYAAGTVLATAHVQGLSDELAALGGGYIYAPPGTYLVSFLELGDKVYLVGAGPLLTSFKIPDGIAYRTSDGATWSGTYGLSCKSGVTHCGMYGFAVDGNYAASADYPHFDSIFDGTGTFVVGRYKVANVAIANLNRSGWVAPDHFWIDEVYSHDGVRSCFLFQMQDGRTGTPGYLHAGKLVAKNSALDHLLYADETDTVSISQFHGMGFANNGMFIASGARVGSMQFTDLATNPISNPTHSYTAQAGWCWEDRPDDRGSIVSELIINGDFAALGGTANTRGLIRSRGFGTTVNAVQLEYTGTDPDLDFMVCYAEGTSGAAGTQYGPTVRSIKGRNMPGRTRLFAHDPSAYGGTLVGGSVKDPLLTYNASAASWAGALYTFDGAKVVNFHGADTTIESADFATRGASALYRNACTSSFNARFDNTSMPRAGAANPPWIDATTTASRVRLSRLVTAAAAPSATLKSTVNKIDQCTFATATIRDSDLLVAYKTADQSIANSTTFVNDTHMKVDVAPGAVYEFEAVLWVDAPIDGDFKVRFIQPGTGTIDFGSVGPSMNVATAQTAAGNDETVHFRTQISATTASLEAGGIAGSGLGVPAMVLVKGVVYTDATTPGTFQCSWAQFTASATANTVVKKGSKIRLQRIA